MSAENRIDIYENQIMELDSEILTILIKDNSTRQNILFATDDYAGLGKWYAKHHRITLRSVTGIRGMTIKPRISKTKEEQQSRIHDKAEVFTPSWICNEQNNLVDAAWFGRKNVFNIEKGKSWLTVTDKITFPDGKCWQNYVLENRLEITCGEAPYLTSRYDVVSGSAIPVESRIGILDRKLRVVSENTVDTDEWYEWAKKAVKSVYGYEWQGDNVLLARENLLYSFIDFFEYKFKRMPKKEQICEIAYILSWNIWQMDGLKFVVPNSCKTGGPNCCEGCRRNDIKKHNGIYSYIMDWEKNKKVKFINLMKK